MGKKTFFQEKPSRQYDKSAEKMKAQRQHDVVILDAFVREL